MSNFLIFKAAFNNSATPTIGTYTAEGATALFNRNTSISPDYYLYNTAHYTAVQWFVPTAETTDFEFVADILTRSWDNRLTYFIIADSAGTTRLRMWSVNDNWHFENSDSITTSGTEYIGTIHPLTSGGFGVFHQFRVRVRKLTESSSSVEVYVDGALKLTATAGAALVTCAKIGFVGGVNTFGPGDGAGIKNAYVYDLSGGDVIDRGVLSSAFNRFISWMKSKFALKSDIPTVNNGTLTIQQNGVDVQTFTANASTNATANITVPTAVSELANDSGYLTSSSNLDASKLTSGTVDIARLPQGALERLVKVANEAARYALTTADVQLGDTVQQLDTGIMYVVTDTDHLDSAAGYTEYTAGTAASVPWSGVTGKPTFAAVATSGAYSDLTGTPTIPTVNNAALTIQQNGTNVQTFTANASTNATANIQCVDLSTAQTVAGDKTLTGTTTTHDVIPATTDTYDLGSSAKEYNNAYIKALTVNGSAAGDILTHNASEFVPRSGGAVLEGNTFARNVDNSYAYFCGGSNATKGACLLLYGKDSSPNNGKFVLSANNGTDPVCNLTGLTNGRLLWGGKDVAMQEGTIPRIGGDVMTGDRFNKNSNNSFLSFSGGQYLHGGLIELYGENHSSYPGYVSIYPVMNGVIKTMTMQPSGTWTWDGTAVQITSDQRYKQQITEIDDKLLDAWEDVELVQFKYNDAVDTKGDKARLHTGFVVQQIDKACKEHGVDISAYGLYCHEEYPEETEEVEVTQKDGTKTKEKKVIREASEHYSLRYTEALIVECKYLRRCIARLTARIEELEKGKEQEATK